MKKCPYCAEEIQDEAIKCRYCGEWLSSKEKQSQDQKEREGEKKAEIKKQEELKEVSPELTEKTVLPTNWLMFWKNVRIPFSILGIIIWTFIYLSDNRSESEGFIIIFINMIIAVFYALVFFGLHRKTLTGWRLNWVLIFGEPAAFILFRETPIGDDQVLIYSIFVFCLFVWVLANFIYFYKRKDLFS